MPSILGYSLHAASDEVRALRQLLHDEWKLIVLLVAGILAVFVFVEPVPPKDVYLAVGQPGSDFEQLGRKFVPIFAAQGVTLHLVNTKGSAESLAELADKDITVSAALMVGGVAKPGAYPNLYSLGSVEYVPLWLFYRGADAPSDRVYEYFSKMRIAVGQQGSATERMLTEVLKVTGITLAERPNILRIPHHEAVEKLLAGEIDAVCLMDGIESANVQALLRHPDVKIYDFRYAPAFVKALRFLDVVTIPQGAFDLRSMRPPTDVHMLASTATILVERRMHPAIQELFVMAADQVSSDIDQFFAKPEFFPAYVDHSVALSPVAKRYFEQGAPALRDKVPIWLLNFVDRVWLLVVGAVAVIYPIFRLFPSYRHIHSTMFINDAYQHIKAVDEAAMKARTRAELQPLVDDLDELDRRAGAALIAAELIGSLYSMRSTLRSQRALMLEQMANLPA
ncbi:MAG: TAXI family TRAP transporter solute-binding subunit [Burkholderiales bacterium]